MSGEVRAHGRRFAVDLMGRMAILELANQAQAAVLSGVKPGDLRWSHPARDFFWLDVSGYPAFLDAYQFIALARRVMEHGEDQRLRAFDARKHPHSCPLVPRPSATRGA